jgi:hypothetical protein
VLKETFYFAAFEPYARCFKIFLLMLGAVGSVEQKCIQTLHSQRGPLKTSLLLILLYYLLLKNSKFKQREYYFLIWIVKGQ